MLPSLSRLKLGPDPAPVGEYEASKQCPNPPGAGDLRNGVSLTPGRSAVFQRSAHTTEVDEMTAEETEEDWKKGTVALDQDTTFVHVASAGLVTDLLEGDKLSTSARIYAHTDIENWTWKGADRVYITWPAGMPFQIMGELRGSDAYQRSCMYLKTNKPLRLTPNEDGNIAWPFANVAVVIPSALYTVVDTPEPVPSPVQVASLYERFASLVESADELPQDRSEKHNMNNTVFTSESEDLIKELKGVFDNIDGKYQQYKTSFEARIDDRNKKRRAVLVALALQDSNLTYKLTVRRTCLYKGLNLKANYIDMTGYVQSGLWNPRLYTFQTPYAEYPKLKPPPPVVFHSISDQALYAQTFLSAYNKESLDMLRIALRDPLDETLTSSMTETEFITWFESSLDPDDDLDRALLPYVIKAFNNDREDTYQGVAAMLGRLFGSSSIDIVDEFKFNNDIAKIVAWVIDYDIKLGKEMLRSMERTLRNNDYFLSEILEEFDDIGDPNGILPFLIDKLGLGVPSTTITLSNYSRNESRR